MKNVIWNDARTLPVIPRGEDRYFWAVIRSNMYDINHSVRRQDEAGNYIPEYKLRDSRVFVTRIDFMNAELTDEERENLENGECSVTGSGDVSSPLDNYINEDGEHIDKTGFYDLEYGGDSGYMYFFDKNAEGYPVRPLYGHHGAPDGRVILAWAEYVTPDAPDWLKAEFASNSTNC